MIKTNLFKFHFGYGSRCVYCGNFNTKLEHVKPLKFQNSIGYVGFSVNRCRECSQVLGNLNHDSFVDRLLFVNRHLLKKSMNGECPEWGEHDLDMLGYTLKKYVKSEMLSSKNLKCRFKFIHSKHFKNMYENKILQITNCDVKSEGLVDFFCDKSEVITQIPTVNQAT